RFADTPGARMFANRLGKNLKRLRSWAERESVSCYRVYDADMPEYAFAIDVYRAIEPDELWLYVQEYAAPGEIELQAVRRRRGEHHLGRPVQDLPRVGAAQSRSQRSDGRRPCVGAGGLP